MRRTAALEISIGARRLTSSTALPLVAREIQQGCMVPDPCVVDEVVDAAPCGKHRVHDRANRRRIGDVALMPAGAILADFVRRALCRRAVAVEQSNAPASASEQVRGDGANPGATAGYQDATPGNRFDR